MGISRDDVIASIEMILGWTPDDNLVTYHLGLGFKDRFELGRYMMSTEEFRRKHGAAEQRGLFLGDRVMTRTHRGDTIYVLPTDLDLTPSMLRNGLHEPHVEQAIVASIRSGDVVVDIGANIGYHTLAMASAVGDRGQVHAFEANPAVAKLLKSSLVVNQMTTFRGVGRVNLYEKAVTDRAGTLTLEQAPGHYGSGHVVTDAPNADFGPEYSTRVQVEAVALDDVLAAVPHVDFMHLDIEGAEPLAIKGAQKLLERSTTIKIISEWSVHMMNTLSDVDAHIGRLAKMGFRFWRVGGGGSLAPVDVADLASLPHCDLFISRFDPSGR